LPAYVQVLNLVIMALDYQVLYEVVLVVAVTADPSEVIVVTLDHEVFDGRGHFKSVIVPVYLKVLDMVPYTLVTVVLIDYIRVGLLRGWLGLARGET
jgi:hypothetical protein